MGDLFWKYNFRANFGVLSLGFDLKALVPQGLTGSPNHFGLLNNFMTLIICEFLREIDEMACITPAWSSRGQTLKCSYFFVKVSLGLVANKRVMTKKTVKTLSWYLQIFHISCNFVSVSVEIHSKWSPIAMHAYLQQALSRVVIRHTKVVEKKWKLRVRFSSTKENRVHQTKISTKADKDGFSPAVLRSRLNKIFPFTEFLIWSVCVLFPVAKYM